MRLAAAVSLALALSGCFGARRDTGEIKMGFTPAENTEKVATNGATLSTLLEQATGYKFRNFVASDYTALVEAMKSNQIQIAWLGPFSFVLAEQQAGARVLLKSVRYGSSNQYAAIVVREDSPYKNIQDLKGKTIAWTDPSSNSGHILPKSALIANGIDPDTFFKRQVFAGSHETAVLAVMNGSVDAAATFSNDKKGGSGAWTMYGKNLGTRAAKLRALFITPPTPSDTVSVSKTFYEEDPARSEKIALALSQLARTPEGHKALMELYGIEGLVPARSEDYQALREAARKLGYRIGGK